MCSGHHSARRAGLGTVPGVELLTSHLLLRRPMAQDAPDALAILQDPDVVRWNPAPAVVDIQTARAWCARGADWSEGTHDDHVHGRLATGPVPGLGATPGPGGRMGG